MAATARARRSALVALGVALLIIFLTESNKITDFIPDAYPHLWECCPVPQQMEITMTTEIKDEDVVTLKELCTQLKIDPYDARQKLRVAVLDAKEYPALAKSHKPKKSWGWPKNSPAIKEVRVVLAK
jgi:hypothetical protein